jgi:hypothetical protein
MHYEWEGGGFQVCRRWTRLTHRCTPTASLRMSLGPGPLLPQTQPLSLASTIPHRTPGMIMTGVDPVMVIHETLPTMFPQDLPSTVVVVLPLLLPKVETPLRLPPYPRLQLPPTTPRPMLPLLPREVTLPRLPVPTIPSHPAPMKSLRQLQPPQSHHRKSILQSTVLVIDVSVPAQDPEVVPRNPGPGVDGEAGKVSLLYDLQLIIQLNLPPLLPPSRPMLLKKRRPKMRMRMRRKSTGRGTLLADISPASRFSSTGRSFIPRILPYITCRC